LANVRLAKQLLNLPVDFKHRCSVGIFLSSYLLRVVCQGFP
jgi:hypothetical protein